MFRFDKLTIQFDYKESDKSKMRCGKTTNKSCSYTFLVALQRLAGEICEFTCVHLLGPDQYGFHGDPEIRRPRKLKEDTFQNTHPPPSGSKNIHHAIYWSGLNTYDKKAHLPST